MANVVIDFDVVIGAPNDADTLVEHIRRIERFDGAVERFIENGPGGGNPNFVARFPDRDAARNFLIDLYSADTDERIADYVDPILDTARVAAR